jgi:hypothetical protein
MCGKFTATMIWAEYVALAGVGIEDAGPLTIGHDKSLGTFTPMSTVPILATLERTSGRCRHID